MQREELDLSATNICRKVLVQAFASVTKELEQGNDAADEGGIRARPSEHSLLFKSLSTTLLMVLSVSESSQYFTTFTTQSFIWLNLALEWKQDGHEVKAFFKVWVYCNQWTEQATWQIPQYCVTVGWPVVQNTSKFNELTNSLLWGPFVVLYRKMWRIFEQRKSTPWKYIVQY